MDDDDFDEPKQTLVQDDQGKIIGGTLSSEEAARRGKLGAATRNQMTETAALADAEDVAKEWGFASLDETPPSIRMMLKKAARKGDLYALKLALRQAGQLKSERPKAEPAGNSGPVIVLSDDVAVSVLTRLAERDSQKFRELRAIAQDFRYSHPGLYARMAAVLGGD